MKKLNQSGMSSIVFAMVFVIILSLLAVGFTTLVRNDQQQVLDKTLSFQAQYAAEAAINRKGAELIAATATGVPVADSGANCNNNLDLQDATFSASAKVTCITWTSLADSIVKDNVGTDPYVSKLRTSAGGLSVIKVTWQSVSTNTTYPATTSLPTIISSNIPILRLTLAKSDLSGLQRTYFVPAGSAMGSVGDGTVQSVTCPGGLCTATFSYDTSGSWISIMAYGGLANVTVSASTGGVAQQLIGAQATIDANAVSQDVTKRVQARIPLVSQTWAPGFALSAGAACKDFKVDGTQATAASAAGNPVCN